MKQIIALLLFSVCAAHAQTVIPFSLTNVPAVLSNQLVTTYQLHQRACRTNAQGVPDLPEYVLRTNVTISVTATNAQGEPTQWATNTTVVRINEQMPWAAWLRGVAADEEVRVALRDAIERYVRRKRAEIGDARNANAGGEP